MGFAARRPVAAAVDLAVQYAGHRLAATFVWVQRHWAVQWPPQQPAGEIGSAQVSAVKTFLQFLVLVAVAAIGGLFALANDQLLTIDLLIWVTPAWSSGVWLLIALALGVLLGFAVAALQYRWQRLRRALQTTQTDPGSASTTATQRD
ncbi:LapA family protein [Gammaproteobacteria bacterium LSUCC0057]|uniref:LapA family protein n=1 Tax=Gammaproteobacteria bacterium LSUCC0057 TaxID=2559237 RepID=A0A4Y8UIY4_9GAMM|nr:LapA family protein [Gammaproteobacteria bacterium LSUCC0057]